MRPIGRGWQYRVYDLSNGKVRKYQRSYIDQFFRVFFACPFRDNLNIAAVMREATRINQIGEGIIPELKDRLFHYPLAAHMGNPTFLGGIDYEQDRVVVLGDHLVVHSLEENKRVLEQYAALLLELWKYGLAERGYNFAINSGVDKNGRVLHLDIAEYWFSREEVENHVRRKVWLGASSYLQLADEELKEYYRHTMEEYLTLENLYALWGSCLRAPNRTTFLSP